MKLNLTILSLVLVSVVSYGLYQLSYEVQKLETDLGSLNENIVENKETIRILKAEWTYQNRPDVLQALAAKYLPLLLIAPYQVADLTEVPDQTIDSKLSEVPVPRHNPRRDYSEPEVIPTGPIQLATFSKSRSLQ